MGIQLHSHGDQCLRRVLANMLCSTSNMLHSMLKMERLRKNLNWSVEPNLMKQLSLPLPDITCPQHPSKSTNHNYLEITPSIVKMTVIDVLKKQINVAILPVFTFKALE